MAQNHLLGLFHEVDGVADAVEDLRSLGVPENRVTVLSGIPYQPRLIGRHHIRQKLTWVALLGALVGVGITLLLTVGTPLLYPLHQGGQPLIPIPPTLIILFEFTMLGTMWATFIGFVLMNRFPQFGKPAYDPRVTEGQIGLLVETDAGRLARAENVLKQRGALSVRRLDEDEREDRRSWGRWLVTVALILLTIGIVTPLFVYDFIRLPFGTQMDDQVSIAYQEGPRLAAPAGAVPVDGPVLIANQPATEPLPSEPDSLQRGQILYNIHCVLCHGDGGAGDGPISGYWTPRPADLTGERGQGRSDEQIFLAITNGFGVMPSLRENLTVAERWDVVNWVRTLGQ